MHRSRGLVFFVALPVFFVTMTPAWGSAQLSGVVDPSITERRYCTPVGPFLIRFDRDKAAGVYAIIPNGHLGSIVGHLEEGRIVGRWYEVDKAGEIEITGEAGWTSFVARYRSDSDPGRWHESWRGQEQPEGHPAQFEHDGVRYRCERPPGSP